MHLPVIAALTAIPLLLALSPMQAGAHAVLEQSDPAPNSVVAKAPSAVTITFTEPLERTYSKAELYDASGKLVSGTTLGEGANDFQMVLNLPPDLPDGTYSVLWRTLSAADGHIRQNYFAFTVGTTADVAAVNETAIENESSEAGPPLWLRAVSRWAALLGLAAVVALWPIWLFVIRPAISPRRHLAPDVTRRMRRYAVIAVLVAFAGDILALVVQAAALTEGSVFDKVQTTLGDTRYGRLWYTRIVLLLIFAVVMQWIAWWRPRRRTILAVIALALSVALPIPFSFIAHASAQDVGRNVALLSDILHLIAASLWVGGLFAIFAVLLPPVSSLSANDRRLVLSRMLPRFSTIALIAWGTLILTGVYNAWLQVGSLDALLHTDYGNALLLKLLLLVPILMLAAFNLLVVTRRLETRVTTAMDRPPWGRRFAYAVGSEALLAILVLLVVGSLTAQEPAREAVAQDAGNVTVALSSDDGDATLTLTPGTPGPNQFVVDFAGEPLAADTDVLLRIQLPDQDTGEQEVTFQRENGSRYTYEGSELSIAGEWQFELVVRPPDAAEWRAFGNATIAAPGASQSAPAPSWLFSSWLAIAGMIAGLAGIAAIVVAWQARNLTNRLQRRQLAGTGVVLVVLAAIVLLLSRTNPVEVTARIPSVFV